MKSKLISLTTLIVLFLCSCSVLNIPLQSSNSPNFTVEPYSTPIPTNTPEPTLSPLPEEHRGFVDLGSQITDYIDIAEGNWGVYVKNLDTNEYIDINEGDMYSASLIKLFIMAAVYNDINEGKIEKDNYVSSLLNLMITESDNDAANTLCEILGDGDIINGFDRENKNTLTLDCVYTVQNTDLQDDRSNSTIEYLGRNYTSPRDCGHLLELIYRNQLYGDANSKEMLELLKNQTVTHKIPVSLPEEVIVANKTGETSSIQNDAAIVYSPACDYIVSIMCNDAYDEDSAIYDLQQISKIVYSYFND